MPYIEHNDRKLSFQLRRSFRAKRLQIILRQSTFEIVAPRYVTNIEILRFAVAQKEWMVKVLGKRPDNIHSCWPLEFVCSEEILYQNRKIKLKVEYGTKLETTLRASTLLLEIPIQSTTCETFSQTIQQQIYKWYQQEAKSIIQRTIDYFCPILDRWPLSFHLKQQKTRWGSCSIQERIYLNWLLVLAPVEVLEYVVVHELCHLFHRNHGKRFWSKVTKCLPNYPEQERWLKTHGQYLRPMPMNKMK